MVRRNFTFIGGFRMNRAALIVWNLRGSFIGKAIILIYKFAQCSRASSDSAAGVPESKQYQEPTDIPQTTTGARHVSGR